MSIRNNISKLILFVLFITPFTSAQTFQRKINLIPVSDPSGLLKNIFSGGHNNFEHQFIDIDGDDDLDIFYLDSDQTFGWFKNTGTKFNPDFEYSLTMPPGLHISNWFYFVDIDSDGDLDYFTGNVDQISFYENDGTVTSPTFILSQDTVKDDQGLPIYSEFSSNPIFVDIDDDGDFDFISGNSAGSLRFYENIGTAQNFNYKFITDVWQNILIIGGRPEDQLHGASSIDFVDIDGDADLDLFWGDFFSKSLYVIENQGTPSNPDMHRISDIYPINSDSIYTSGFNMPRFADIDGDSDYDLFVSVLYDPTVRQSLMYLKNNGTAQAANHNLITNDFLKTLDVGNNSAPVFIDIDNDNDLDLFIGSLNNPIGSIHFLENTGSHSDPVFYYQDSTFFDITSDLSVSPAFGDLDDDGDFDLIVGKFNGKLDIYLNTGTPNSPFFSNGAPLLNNIGEEIDIGSSATPFLLDMDNDIDLDLIIGGFNGKFNLYENTGNVSFFQFTLNSLYFESLDIGDNSTPFIVDYNKDDVFDLFSGNRNGESFYFRNDGSNSAPIWTEITNNFISDDFGAYTFPCFVDLDADTDLDLFLGNVKGGLYFYNNSEISTVAERNVTLVNNFEITAFPNPFNPLTQIKIELSEAQDLTIEIFNLLGEKVKSLFSGYIPAGTNSFYWDAKDNAGIILPSGAYFILAHTDQNQKVIKVAFLK
ncbi:MAG: FG-GAP-like repeat-containing protein [Ignavibacteriaceae bacterium]